MPDEYKLAFLYLLLKKLGLDLILGNYRPVSNLPYLSKHIERGVAYQLINHMKDNALFEKFQSAYLEGRCTENAFNTVNQSILLDRLHTRMGVRGKALDLIKSYLSDRNILIRIEDASSATFSVTCGVPQGSVLGPMLFKIYTSPIGNIMRKHNLYLHIYINAC
jgi:hypothetical protein